LSPLQFIIATQAFSKMISATVNGGLLSGFSVGPRNIGVLNISHLFFVGRHLNFLRGKPKSHSLLAMLVLMRQSCLKFKISLAKSELVPIGNVYNVDGQASILGCRVSSLPMKYLSLPLGASFKAKSI
jgi:hypothetical protein